MVGEGRNPLLNLVCSHVSHLAAPTKPTSSIRTSFPLSTFLFVSSCQISKQSGITRPKFEIFSPGLKKIQFYSGISATASICLSCYPKRVSGCCCSVAESCLIVRDSMDCSTPGFPVLHLSRSLLKLVSIELVMPSNHLVLCCLLLLLPSIFPSIRDFINELTFCIRWPKY